MPGLIALKTVVDRLKNISSAVTIIANNNGEFRLRAESDEASVQTEWRNLTNPTISDSFPSFPPSMTTNESSRTDAEAQDLEEDERTSFHSVTVDTKNLLKFLNSYSIATSTIACSFLFLGILGDDTDTVR